LIPISEVEYIIQSRAVVPQNQPTRLNSDLTSSG
jgi:hypothetical protein